MDETVNQEVVTEEPEKTFTQTELDRIVGERLAREREKYADYSVLKEKAGRFDELEEAQKTELQKATERATAAEEELAALKKANEVRAMRDKVSAETGVPANLLTADNEEECTALAEAIKAYATPGYPTVQDHGEVPYTPASKPDEQFKEWFDANFK